MLSGFCTNHKHQNFPKVSQLLEKVADISVKIAVQWIPRHCEIKGNKQADSPIKYRYARNQIEEDMSLE